MKKIITITLVAIFAVVFWHFRFGAQKLFNELPALSKVPGISELKQEISSPPPLVSQDNHPNSTLTRLGIIKWTNTNRAQNGNLPALTENSQLDKAAQLKLQDMFKQQYFEHVNPQGVGPGDLAKKAGYVFIMEGENLALGNFENDQALLTAWMNSPGHRANILNEKYMEMGAAAGQGMYEGKKVWLAVQEFGKPASSCPSVDKNLKSQLDSLQAEANQIQFELDGLKNQMDASHPKIQEDYDAYNKLVAQYNDLVKVYNNKIDNLKMATDNYNAQVRSYNACAS